jgi:hypothetical protein
VSQPASEATRGPIQIDFWYDSGCPNAALVKDLLTESLLHVAAGRWTLHEHRDAGILSPTVTVNGEDVMAGDPPRGIGCRLDLPTGDRISQALEQSHKGDTDV